MVRNTLLLYLMLAQEQSGLGLYSWLPVHLRASAKITGRFLKTRPYLLTGWDSVPRLFVLLGSTMGRAEQQLPDCSSDFIV